MTFILSSVVLSYKKCVFIVDKTRTSVRNDKLIFDNLCYLVLTTFKHYEKQSLLDAGKSSIVGYIFPKHDQIELCRFELRIKLGVDSQYFEKDVFRLSIFAFEIKKKRLTWKIVELRKESYSILFFSLFSNSSCRLMTSLSAASSPELSPVRSGDGGGCGLRERLHSLLFGFK